MADGWLEKIWVLFYPWVYVCAYEYVGESAVVSYPGLL